MLLFPDASWSDSEIIPDSVNLTTVEPPKEQFQSGEDKWADITPDDFFDIDWSIASEDPGQGVQSFSGLEDLRLLAVPDLYSPAPVAAVENIIDPVSLAGPDFAKCIDVAVKPPKQGFGSYDLAGLRLDPRDPADLKTIIGLQQKLVAFADSLEQLVVLLDVPPGLTQRQILKWRTTFNSSYAACYHPWLQISRRDQADNVLVQIPPSAPAAGIIASTAIQFGVPTGPANVLAAQAVNVADVVTEARHDELHPLGINVYLRERDGVRLTAARTLSRDPQYRQLTVRRLITLLRLTLYQQMQWAVFEPNGPALRLEIRLLLISLLRSLFRQGAFAGVKEADSFFVRCDDTNNPRYVTDAGMLIAEIGVAPSEPIEFIVIRISRGADGTLSVQD
jgi:phage tail sheath protein FI